MNKRTYLLLIVFLSFLGSSYIAKVEPKIEKLKLNGKDSFNLASDLPLPKIFPFGIKTVVIDAGHGGKDPGCLGITTVKEKDVALGIALKLGKYIEEKIPDVKVIYTRSTDVFVELDERAAIANRNKADLFICIHCNTACSLDKRTRKKNCNQDVYGTETYVMGLHKTQANLNVARRENEAILLEKNYQKRYDGFDPNSETGYILLTMQQNAYLKQSLNFAAKVQKQVKEKAGRVDKGVQQAGFLVLWRTAMPSVLIETEFISNTESENFVGSDKGQDKMARAIFSAFRQYKDEVEGKLVKYDDDIANTKYISQKDTTTAKKKEQEKPKKDSIPVPVKKEPVIQNDDSIKIAPKDSSLIKNAMIPPVKIDSAAPTLKGDKPKLLNKKDSIPVKQSSPDSTLQGGGKTIYKIQFATSSQRIPLLSDKFKGLKNIGEYQDGNIYKYTAGEFKTLADAMKYRTEMQSKGFKDCFVVKFKDGKRIKN